MDFNGEEVTNDADIELVFSDDPTIQELQSLKFIFPDSKINLTALVGEIKIPITVEEEVLISLVIDGKVLEQRKVTNIPDITFKFQCPKDYPHQQPPKCTLESLYISSEKIDEILHALDDIWQSHRDCVIYNYIDYLQDKIHHGLLGVITVDHLTGEKFQKCVEFNDFQLQQQFNDSSFTCQICQCDYKGISCIKFEKCNHIFCKSCLNDFFKSIIVAGDVERIHCPDFVCTKDHVRKIQLYSHLDNWTKENIDVEQIIQTLLTPAVSLSLLSQILDNDSQIINRYYDLYKRSQFEFIGKLLPKRLVECPRIGCDEIIFRKDLNDQLVICHQCGYAFCNRCCNSWHSKSVICKALKSNSHQYWGVPIEDLQKYINCSKTSHDIKTLNSKYGRLVMIKAVNEFEMDQLFNKMLQENSTIVKCPDCEIVIEKINGCNKICCTKCQTYFCFICGEVTGNSYDHFSDTTSHCYGRLFEGMPGMEDRDIIHV